MPQDLFAPPQKAAEYLVAYVDGGARGNPGPAGFGVRIENQNGEKVTELSQYLGRQTNNFAEYSGLIAALEYAIAHNYRGLRVISDSELMVRQIKGIYKVRNQNLRPLHERARALIRKLDYFEIGHVLRAKNKDADRLANEAMDRGSKPCGP
jgi:ribonuclease HI